MARDVNKLFSKPCLVNLISKDTHLVFSISLLVVTVNAFANILYPDHARQNAGPDLDPIRLIDTLTLMVFLINFTV